MSRGVAKVDGVVQRGVKEDLQVKLVQYGALNRHADECFAESPRVPCF